MDDAYEDYNDWWDDLTIEQRRAAFEAWQQSPVKSIYINFDNTTHSQVVTHMFEPREKSDKEKEHDEIRKQLASKVVWDQDRFKPWNDRLKDDE